MYALPEMRAANDAWWAGLATHFSRQGIDNPPKTLSSTDPDRYVHWLSDDLLFSQTCGFPLTHRLAGQVRLLGAPVYEATGCEGPTYRSLIIARADVVATSLADLAPCRVAVNGFDSQSGWNVLRPFARDAGGWAALFKETIESGGHAASIDMVRDGEVDVAAIDCVTHALIQDHQPGRLAGTHAIARTAGAPTLPYITGGGTPDRDVSRLKAGIRAAMSDGALAEVRRDLRLIGFEDIGLSVYQSSIEP